MADTQEKRSSKSIDDELAKYSPHMIQLSTASVSNGCLLHLLSLHKTATKVHHHLNELIGYKSDFSKLESYLRGLSQKLKETKKSINRDAVWKKFLSHLQVPWEIIRERSIEDIPSRKLPSPAPQPKKAKPQPKLRSDCPKCPVLQAKIDILNESVSKLRDDRANSAMKLKAESGELKKLKEKQSLSEREWKDQVKRLKKELADEIMKADVLSSEKSLKSVKCKKLNEKVKLHKQTIKNLRSTKNNYYAQLKRKSRDPTVLSRKLASEKLKVTLRNKRIVKYDIKIEDLESQIKDLKKEINQYEIYVDNLVCEQLEVTENSNEEKSPVTEYNPDVRRVIYQALHSKVPLANAAELIRCAVKTLGDGSTPDLPSASTIARMSSEIGVIAYVQAAETLLESDDAAVLAWDATTLNGAHINEVHIQTTKQTFTLACEALDGGSTADYVAHLTGVIDRMARFYSEYKELDPVHVKESILSRIKATCTDRAHVNTATVRELRNLWKADLLELHCNVHPIDSFAGKIRTSLKKLDASWGFKSTGTDCAVANFMYSLSKLRIKETGDPAGFSSFLEEHGISPSQILRYVGTKWNVLWLMPAVVLEHRLLLTKYLEHYCRNESKLRSDLVWAIKNEQLLTQLRALALIGKVITTPWMEEFYGNKKNLSNLQMVPHLKLFTTKINEYSADPLLILSATHTIFGEPLEKSTLLMWLQDTLPSEGLLSCLQMMIKLIKEVGDRQLQRYTTGELSNVTEEMLEATKASTPHNVWAERALGTLNAFWDRAKQASIDFLSEKVKMASNHIMAYLDSLDSETMHSLVKFAVKAGAQLHKEQVQRRKDFKKAQARKMRARAQKRDEKKRKNMEKKIVEVLISKSIHNLESVDDLKELFNSLKEYEKEKVVQIVEGKDMKEVSLLHDWLEEDESTETYHGLILEPVKRAHGILSYKTQYWLPGLRNESLTTNNIRAEQLIVDILLGDLKFIQ